MAIFLSVESGFDGNEADIVCLGLEMRERAVVAVEPLAHRPEDIGEACPDHSHLGDPHREPLMGKAFPPAISERALQQAIIHPEYAAWPSRRGSATPPVAQSTPAFAPGGPGATPGRRRGSNRLSISGLPWQPRRRQEPPPPRDLSSNLFPSHARP